MYGYYGKSYEDVIPLIASSIFKDYRLIMMPYMCPAGVAWWDSYEATSVATSDSAARPERRGIYLNSFQAWDPANPGRERIGGRKATWVAKPSSYFIVYDTDFSNRDYTVDPKYPHHPKRTYGVAFFDGSARIYKRPNTRNGAAPGYWEYGYWRYLGDGMD